MNLRPLDPQSSTLPAALHPDLQWSIKPCLNRIPNPEGKVKCFVKIPAGNLRHVACFERRRTVNPSETAYTLREPIANTAITIRTSNPSAAESERPGFLNLHIAQARDVQRQTQPIREQMRCQNRTQPQQRIFDRTKRRRVCHATREQKTGQHSDHNRCKHALRAPVLPETSAHTLSRTRHNTLSSSEHLISLGTKRSPQKRTPFLI